MSDRNAGILVATGAYIAQSLNLPSGSQINAIDYEASRDLWYIHITGEGLPIVPEGQKAKEVSFTVKNGKSKWETS